MTEGTAVVVSHLAKQGRIVGAYGFDACIVKLDDGRVMKFDYCQLAPVQQRAEPKALKLAPPPGMDEEDVQAQTVADLIRAGFTVLQTSVRYHAQQCKECGTWARPQGGTGTTPGVPDLLVTREEWPVGIFLGLEMKDLDGRLQPEQELLAAQARIVVTRSRDFALATAEATHEDLTAAFAPPVLDRDAVDAARLKVEKARIKRAERAAQRKRGKK